MAAPKKDPDQKRSEVARARVTLAEKERVIANAQTAGMTETNFIRARILGEVIRSSNQSVDPALVHAINRVGNNVNQLARSVHRGSDFQAYWREVGDELERVLNVVLERYAP